MLINVTKIVWCAFPVIRDDFPGPHLQTHAPLLYKNYTVEPPLTTTSEETTRYKTAKGGWIETVYNDFNGKATSQEQPPLYSV